MTEPVASYGGLRVLGELRRVRLLHQAPRRAAARLRSVPAPRSTPSCSSRAWRRLPLRMDAHVANASAVAQHLAEHPHVAWVSLRRPARLPVPRAGPALPARGPGAVFAFGVRGGRDAGRAFIESVELCQPSGQRRRHPHARHPPGLDHPSAAVRRGAGGGRRQPRPGPHLRRHRGRRRHRLGPRPGPAAAAKAASMTPERATVEQVPPGVEAWHPPSARDRLPFFRAPEDGRHRRARRPTAPGPATSSPPTCSAPAPTSRCGSSTRGRRRSSAIPCIRRLAALPEAPDLVDVFRTSRGPTGRGGRRRGRGCPDLLGPARALERRGGGHRPRGRAGRRHEPLPQDRARPVRRRAAPRRLRHRRHQFTPAGLVGRSLLVGPKPPSAHLHDLRDGLHHRSEDESATCGRRVAQGISPGAARPDGEVQAGYTEAWSKGSRGQSRGRRAWHCFSGVCSGVRLSFPPNSAAGYSS